MLSPIYLEVLDLRKDGAKASRTGLASYELRLIDQGPGNAVGQIAGNSEFARPGINDCA